MSVPKLRFKEFDGDWFLNKIGNIASKVGSGSTPRGGAEAYTSEGIIFIRSQNVNNDRLLLDDVAYITDEIHNKMSGSKIIANDILLNITGASIGRSCVVPSDFNEGNVNQHVCIIRTPNDDPIFIQSFLSSDNGQNAIESKQVGSGREGLNFQAIRSIHIFLPNKKEQTKIASFLSSVDEKISQLTQKHKLLSQYKQGMMQKLFSQQIRFKADDASEFGEWESISIKNAVSFIKDGTHGTHQDDPTSHLFLLSAKNLQNGQVVIDEKDRRINKLEFDSIYKNYGLNTGDILLSVVGTIGRVAIFKEEYKNYAFQRSVAFMRFKSAKPEFIFQLFNAVDFQNELLVRQVVSAQPGIYLGDLSKIEIKLPCLEEQTKIANFLSAIDQKIEVVAQQIEQAKQWKKGLLQQMFV
ncbi:restriction endonuclease subunit S [Acinetobacter baylyi]|uniref:restriction endonuclease subunit S n=1 Tax=Acinetobacter baylyi TaxID=202950 RepID=UPI0031D04897